MLVILGGGGGGKGLSKGGGSGIFHSFCRYLTNEQKYSIVT